MQDRRVLVPLFRQTMGISRRTTTTKKIDSTFRMLWDIKKNHEIKKKKNNYTQCYSQGYSSV